MQEELREWQGAGGIEGVARGDNGSGRVQEELREWQGETREWQGAGGILAQPSQ